MKRVTQYTVQLRQPGGEWEVFPWPQRSMAGPWQKRETADKLYIHLSARTSDAYTFVYGRELRIAERSVTYDDWSEAS